MSLTLSESAQIESPTVGVVLPVERAERIVVLDTLRGFALLGILLMNIVGFGLYHEAYNNPTSAGGDTGLNLWTWIVLHVLAEGKMRCLFSLVFGAGVVLLTTRLEGRPDGADIYYRRTLWLLVFGVIHSFLLWQGEILYPYALCGLTLYPFRRLRPGALIAIGTIALLILSGFYIVDGRLKLEMMRDGKAAIAKAAGGARLTEGETTARSEWERFKAERNPTAKKLEEDAQEWRGNVMDVIQARGRVRLEWDSLPFYHPYTFDIWGMMLLGMGLFKLGVLSAERSLGFYAGMTVLGLGLGVAVNSYTAALNVRHHFDPAVQITASSLYDFGRYAVASGYIGLLMILCKTGRLTGLTSRLAAVGQMALTNYVTHSVICAFLFTGYGFGLYGRLERYQLYYGVFAIWLLQLLVSPLWLRHYHFGPLEWAWRALTYWKRPPFRIAASDA